MSDSDPQTPSPPSPSGDPSSGDEGRGQSKGSGGGRGGGREQKPSSNLFWFLMIVGAIAAIVFSVFNQAGSSDELTFSEFVGELERTDANTGDPVGRFNRSNVYELIIGVDAIRFQDKAKPEDKPDPSDTKFFEVPFLKPAESDVERPARSPTATRDRRQRGSRC